MQMPKAIQIKNGEKVSHDVSRLKNMPIARRSCAGLSGAEQYRRGRLHLYHNINYYSDFLYCSLGRQYALVVTQDSAVTISANIDGGQPMAPYRRH